VPLEDSRTAAKRRCHSIISSARIISGSGMSMPRQKRVSSQHIS